MRGQQVLGSRLSSSPRAFVALDSRVIDNTKFQPSTLNLQPSLKPEISIFNPQHTNLEPHPPPPPSSTLNLQSSPLPPPTLNLQPSTPQPTPQHLNPQPSTTNRGNIYFQ